MRMNVEKNEHFEHKNLKCFKQCSIKKGLDSKR